MGYLGDPLLDSLDGAMQTTGDAGKGVAKEVTKPAITCYQWAGLISTRKEKAIADQSSG
jgi:hypothetical protein